MMKLFIFGSTGDLVKRKVLPALQELFVEKKAEELEIFALGRKDFTEKVYRDFVCEGKCIAGFRKKINYLKVDFEKRGICGECLKLLDKEKENLFYISLPPSILEKIFMYIAIISKKFKIRILVEKPFGNSFENARKISEIIEKNKLYVHLSDHYLFKDGFFKAKKEIENKIEKVNEIEIVSIEKLGLEGRNYYDETGAIKDMIQSHFLNMLFEIINPKELEKSEIEKFARGQYGNGKDKGYVKELGKSSETETFVDVSFKTNKKKIRFVTGKAFKEKISFIKIDDKTFNLEDKENPYKNLFLDFFNNKKEKFQIIENALSAWKIAEVLEKNKPKLEYYDKGKEWK